MNRLEAKHHRAIRWMHWINVPVLTGMIWSGLLIYWANDVYRVGFGQITLFHFFPAGFYELLGLEHRLAEGMAWHFLFMWFFVINGVLYVGYTAMSGEWPTYSTPPHPPGGNGRRVARSASPQGAPAAPEIQRGTALGLYRHYLHGGLLAAHGA